MRKPNKIGEGPCFETNVRKVGNHFLSLLFSISQLLNTKMIQEVWPVGCRDFCTAIYCKMITSKKSKEDWQMKGYDTSNGYMGYVEGKYILFASEQEYFEFMED